MKMLFDTKFAIRRGWSDRADETELDPTAPEVALGGHLCKFVQVIVNELNAI